MEEMGGVANAPRGPEGALLDDVVDGHVEIRAVPEPVADVGAEVVEGDHDLGDAVVAEQPQVVLDHRGTHHWHHRLGGLAAERPEPRALASGHDDGFHDLSLVPGDGVSTCW